MRRSPRLTSATSSEKGSGISLSCCSTTQHQRRGGTLSTTIAPPNCPQCGAPTWKVSVFKTGPPHYSEGTWASQDVRIGWWISDPMLWVERIRCCVCFHLIIWDVTMVDEVFVELDLASVLLDRL